MPSLSVKPPHPSGSRGSSSSSPPRLLRLSAPSPPPPSYIAAAEPGSTSPVAPEYSPITPKVQPVLPAAYPPLDQYAPSLRQEPGAVSRDAQPTGPPALYIPEPAPRPFSGEDEPDAIALRAAISSLQFQKQKARDDLRSLEKLRTRALQQPGLFSRELAAGRLKEERPTVANLQAILDQADSEEEEEEEEEGEEGGDGKEEEDGGVEPRAPARPEGDAMIIDEGGSPQVEIPETQASRPTSSSSSTGRSKGKSAFDPIPGPQNVVRMPYINWDKYHIAGDALDSMHEQQRRWPGNFAYGTDRGREHVVAAPYSPWLDSVDGQQHASQRWDRNDSLHTPMVTPTTTVSEHPMETRRGGQR